MNPFGVGSPGVANPVQYQKTKINYPTTTNGYVKYDCDINPYVTAIHDNAVG